MLQYKICLCWRPHTGVFNIRGWDYLLAAMFVRSKVPTLVLGANVPTTLVNVGLFYDLKASNIVGQCEPFPLCHVLFCEKGPWRQVDVSKRIWEEAAASSRSQPIYCHTGWWFQRCWVFETTDQYYTNGYQLLVSKHIIPSWWINYWIFHVSTDPKIDVFSCGMGHLERFVRPWCSGPPVNYIISGYRICLPEFPVKLLNYVPTWRFRGNLGAPRNVLDNLLEPQHGFLLHCVALDHLHHVQVFPGAAVRDPWLKRLVIGEVPVVPELEEYLITSPVYMKRVNQEWMGEEGMKPHLYHLWDHLYPLVN